MILARRAPVKPRVLCPGTAVVVPLEDEVKSLVEAGHRGAVRLLGGQGSGKTTALEHLMAVLPPDANVLFLDEPDAERVARVARDLLVVYTTASDEPRAAAAIYRLAAWGDDDLIEYLLAVHKDRCASVMARLSSDDRALMRGAPELWRIALDVLADEPSVPDARIALHRHVSALCPDPGRLELARSVGLELLTAGDQVSAVKAVKRLEKRGGSQHLLRLVRHAPVQLLLGAERVTLDLRRNASGDALALRLPRELVLAVARSVAGDDRVLQRLRLLLAGPSESHAMAASVLHAADRSWVPESTLPPTLIGAYLDGAFWQGARLAGVKIRGTDLSGADLRGADLDGADAVEADLRRARLEGASMVRVDAQLANLSGADLSGAVARNARFDAANLEGANLEGAILASASFAGADLTGAGFRGADLSGASFSPVRLEGADFSDANLEGAVLTGVRLRDGVFAGARFARAQMVKCDLEGMDLPNADFQDANLEGALLTATSMPDANFAHACLRGAGLAEVNWERACLQSADLREASFHMGSTRSGLLFTTIASEGTRTGFYTDDFDEQSFKEPEEIRKANLRGADLRGARIDDVDFYLVDVRDALYDPDQELHLRRCRAIL